MKGSLASHCFDLHVAGDKWLEKFFVYFLTIFKSSLTKFLFSLFQDGVVYGFCCSILQVIYVFWIVAKVI